ncbi:MAG: DUF4339 domain-containing protein [Tepidisphaeraceae bacterium]|jgi:hypothetical protein
MAIEVKWFYAQGGQQSGPISAADLKELIGRGQIGPADMVWHEGMPKWAPAGEMPELMPPQAAGTVTAAKPITVGYYTSTLGFPQRAVANLRGHATPRGDTGDWPLDDVRISHFEETVKLRKKVAAAASLYRSLLLLTAISFAVMLPVSLFAVFSAGNSARAMSVGILPITGVMLGFCFLYYFANRATRKSQRWAPLTMFIIFLASGVLQVVSILGLSAAPVATGPGPGLPAPFVGLIIVLVFVAAFAYVSWRAFAAIPQYLAQPAWCQELIVKAGL